MSGRWEACPTREGSGQRDMYPVFDLVGLGIGPASVVLTGGDVLDSKTGVKFDSSLIQMTRVRVEESVEKVRGLGRVKVEHPSESSYLATARAIIDSPFLLTHKHSNNAWQFGACR